MNCYKFILDIDLRDPLKVERPGGRDCCQMEGGEAYVS